MKLHDLIISFVILLKMFLNKKNSVQNNEKIDVFGKKIWTSIGKNK